MGEKNPKSVGWNDEIKAAVRRMEASDEETKKKMYGSVQRGEEKG